MAFGPAAVLTFATKVATFIITALTAIVLARWLGPAARGEYAVLTLIPAAIVAAVNLGLATAITVSVGRDPGLAARALSGAIAFTAVASVAGWIAALATSRWWSTALADAPPVDTALAIFVALPLLLYAQLIAILQGLRDFRTTSTLILLSYVSVFALQIVLVVWLDLALRGAILAFVGGHVLIAAVALALVARSVGAAALDVRMLGAHLRVGAPSYLGALTWLVLSRAPLFTCAVLLPSDDVGRFAVALVFVEVLLYAADSVVFALTPHAAAVSVGEHYALTPLATRAVIVAAGSGAIALFVGAPLLVTLLFGADFAAAAASVRWLLPGVIAASVARVLAADLVARDSAWLGLAGLAAGGAAAVVSGPSLVGGSGIAGAAAAWSLGHAVAAAALVGAYVRTTGVTPITLLVPRRGDIDRATAMIRRRSGLTKEARLTLD